MGVKVWLVQQIINGLLATVLACSPYYVLYIRIDMLFVFDETHCFFPAASGLGHVKILLHSSSSSFGYILYSSIILVLFSLPGIQSFVIVVSKAVGQSFSQIDSLTGRFYTIDLLFLHLLVRQNLEQTIHY